MTPHTSPRSVASGLVALVATGALLLGATPALAQSASLHASAARVASSSGAPSAATGAELSPGGELLAGEYLDAGGYTFRMQDDGNAVTYDEVGHAVFSTGTSGRGNRLVLQQDGNVVIYSDQNRPLWSTGTDVEANAHLVVQSDGNLVLYREGGSPAWASSIGRTIPEPPFSVLDTGEPLRRGHQLTSPNGLFRAVMQRDGNFVGYGPNGVVWSTGTRGADNMLEVAQDGYVVITGADGAILWTADTEYSAGSISLEDNGLLGIVDENGAPIWDSQTALPGATIYTPSTLYADGLLRSDDGRFRAVVQGDGNVVVYGPEGAVWSTGTSGIDNSMDFEADGTATVSSTQGEELWTATPAPGGVAPFHFVMQSDGNLVEYDVHDRAVWSSR